MRFAEQLRMERRARFLRRESDERCVEITKLLALGARPADVGGLIDLAADTSAEARGIEDELRKKRKR